MSFDLAMNISSLVLTEYNFSVGGSSFGTAFSNAQTFFDQYCLYSLTFTFSSNLGSGFGIRFMTAIDYDNTAMIGIAGIQGFSSYNESVLGGDGKDCLVRFVKPCIAPQVTSSNVPVAGGIGRAWLDIAYAAVAHYGLRTIAPIANATAAGGITCTVSGIFGFRNNQ